MQVRVLVSRAGLHRYWSVPAGTGQCLHMGLPLSSAQWCAVVFCARYVDLFWNFSSMYNWVLKICFISASLAIVYFMRFGTPQKATYNADQDAFPIQYLIGPCALLGLIVNQDHYSAFEIVWAFSVYLEAVAILPQLFLLQKLGEVRQTKRAAVRYGLISAPRARAGREPDFALRVRARRLPRALPAQLVVQVHDRGGLPAADCVGSRHRANRAVLRLLLPLLRVQKGRDEQVRQIARLIRRCLKHTDTLLMQPLQLLLHPLL